MDKGKFQKSFPLWFVSGLILALALIIWFIFYLNPARQVGFINLYSDSQTPSDFNPDTYFIDNQTDLNNLLTRLYPNDLPPGLIPFKQNLSDLATDPLLNKGVVNFDENIILVIFLGERPTGGYNIDVSDITSRWGKTKVTILETIPGSDCLSTQVITSPWRLMLVERTDNKIEIIKETETKSCAPVIPASNDSPALPANL